MQYRDLEKVRAIIADATGLDIAYAYDDLVFPDHTAFIIQYDNDNQFNLFYHHHEDCVQPDEAKIFENLELVCKKHHFTIERKGAFSLEQKGEEVDIHFK